MYRMSGELNLIHNSKYPETYIQRFLFTLIDGIALDETDMEITDETVGVYIDGEPIYVATHEYLGSNWYIHRYRVDIETSFKLDINELTRYIATHNLINGLVLAYRDMVEGTWNKEKERLLLHTVAVAESVGGYSHPKTAIAVNVRDIGDRFISLIREIANLLDGIEIDYTSTRQVIINNTYKQVIYIPSEYMEK